ncbi:response regulator transcription factor [Pseudomonas gregormendelii]|uniref:Response regulator transcription factor n=1 Tax=Pseudomonas gregormendelii TaxID=1628277 RepID=A0ABS3API5_9PSED|nr:response regulator [Pseudomonas gregormendelii]MBN3968792.1 response regulator transcription factor [Pseudomonas gregormendelii]
MNRDASSTHSSIDGPIVFVIDDEESVRVALSSLFRSIDIRVETFAKPAEFLEHTPPDIPSCLVLDVRLKGLSGLEFQQKLVESNTTLPVIFMTGHGDIAMAIQAMKAGAVDFLVKPFRDQDLLDAVSAAHQIDTQRRGIEKRNAEMNACFLRKS